MTLLQVNSTPRNRAKGTENTLTLIRERARQNPGVLLLPEIWSGGFEYPQIRDLAEETPALIKELCAISHESRSVIIGSLPEKSRGKLLNTAFVVDSGRVIGRYRKQRLFSPMEEDRHFSTCRSPRTFSTSLGVLGVIICFDLRFPELLSGLRQSDAWLLAVPAQWPLPRCEHWKSLLIARAIENQIFVAGCNRVGRTGNTRFCGNSMLLGPWGDPVIRSGRRVAALTAAVRPERVAEVRSKIPMDRP